MNYEGKSKGGKIEEKKGIFVDECECNIEIEKGSEIERERMKKEEKGQE